MKLLLKLFSLVPLLAGLAILALGLYRYQLPYENGRYFDPAEGVVYHVEAATVYTIAGVVLTLVGIVVALASFGVLPGAVRLGRRTAQPSISGSARRF